MEATRDRLLDDLLADISNGTHIIHRVVVDEYQVTFVTDQIDFCSHLAVTLSRHDGGQVHRMDADWRKRNDEAYTVCSVVGHTIDHARFVDGALELRLANFGVMLFLKTEGIESFHIHTRRHGGTFLF